MTKLLLKDEEVVPSNPEKRKKEIRELKENFITWFETTEMKPIEWKGM